jgi:hypothetical protein
MYKSWKIEVKYGSEYLGTKDNKGYHEKYKHEYVALNEIWSTLYAGGSWSIDSLRSEDIRWDQFGFQKLFACVLILMNYIDNSNKK